jgi:hypothetical protein
VHAFESRKFLPEMARPSPHNASNNNNSNASNINGSTSNPQNNPLSTEDRIMLPISGTTAGATISNVTGVTAFMPTSTVIGEGKHIL